MKSKLAIKTILSKLVPSPKVVYCSQTIYEALLGCIRMYEATDSAVWKKRANHVLNILIKIQRPDGGFDIGYEFNFGRIHKKGDSTSPELVGLLAYSEYARVFDARNTIKPYADKASEWIRQFSIKFEDDVWAIPYSPYTINKVMVYNGTSFACGALGHYLGVFGVEDENLLEIYSGMVNYLEKSLYASPEFAGRFWYYPVQSRTDMSKEQLNKIDYYHQMQQVEMHSYAQCMISHDAQMKIIEECSDHIVNLSNKFSVIPYTNNSNFFGGHIHVWGFCSVASGLIEAAKLLPDKRNVYVKQATDVIDWIVNNSWNGDFFSPILTKSGEIVGLNEYMVRSDAWVFNALAAYFKDVSRDEKFETILEKCYLKMESCDFSGKESHAGSFRKKLFSKLVGFLRKVIR